MGSDPGPLGTDGLLDHLHHDILAWLENVLNIGGLIQLLVPLMVAAKLELALIQHDVPRIQECVAL